MMRTEKNGGGMMSHERRGEEMKTAEGWWGGKQNMVTTGRETCETMIAEGEEQTAEQ